MRQCSKHTLQYGIGMPARMALRYKRSNWFKASWLLPSAALNCRTSNCQVPGGLISKVGSRCVCSCATYTRIIADQCTLVQQRLYQLGVWILRHYDSQQLEHCRCLLWVLAHGGADLWQAINTQIDLHVHCTQSVTALKSALCGKWQLRVLDNHHACIGNALAQITQNRCGQHNSCAMPSVALARSERRATGGCGQ
jgi:hypothetical protein